MTRPNPYRIDGPAVVSFSGGRTSGYMLWHILDAFGGVLPDDVEVIFNNTGKERSETLDFVERVSQQWNVPITWLEYDHELREGERKKSRNGRLESPYKAYAKVVDYATASRNGEPFMKVIRARNMLPNVMARFCTVELKILTSQRYLKSLGWERWENAIGLRGDEPHRVAKVRTTNRHSNEEPLVPLFEANVSLTDVMKFWEEHPFDLALNQHEGNCDLCFLKGMNKVKQIMKDRPDLAGWWIEAEAEAERIGVRNPSVAFFRKDRPRYAKLLELSQLPGLFDGHEPDELSIACHCTD
jgi:3'-phosphoadenosine 5'-phosphosulfate sulfotransferase (PAPS reductase)/FAD synthetase